VERLFVVSDTAPAVGAGERRDAYELNKNATDWERPWQKSRIKKTGLTAMQRRAQRKYREQAPILI